MFNNNTIIITSNYYKNSILEKNNALSNCKIYNQKEFYKQFYFDYSKETVYYITEKYNVNPEIAELYLENMYYIKDIEYKNKKITNLLLIKQDLIDNKKIIINKLFKNKLKKNKIIIYNLPQTKELDILVNELKEITEVTITNDPQKEYEHNIYELKSIEEEVVYVAEKICSLVNKNIPINKIYLTNIDNDYYKIIKRLFPMFNIPYTLEDKSSIYGTYICNRFIEWYESDLNNTINKLHEIASPLDEQIINQIIDIINKYSFIEDKVLVKEFIINDLKKTNIIEEDNQLSVHETSIDNHFFEDDDYVFLLSFNQGIIPKIYKDEAYLSDNDCRELNISYTVDKNNNSKTTTINKIKSIKNLVITTKKKANGEEFTLSNINEELKYDLIAPTIEYIYSNKYNQLKLASLLDNYHKYGQTSQLLNSLNSTYPNLSYNTYNNKFTGIQPTELADYLHNELTLSYSSIDTYFKCPFSFYIGNILKLNIFETTFQQFVGNLFHAILEKRSSLSDYDTLWEEEKNKLEYQPTIEESFLLIKLKEELRYIISVIDNQENFTNLHDELHEQRIYTNINTNTDIKFKFTGIIDKIKYKNEQDKTILSIIDYKTGNPNLELSTIPYGINLQLPMYVYLAKHFTKFNNPVIAGFYLQKILNNEVSVDKTHTYEELKKKNLLLQGYSNSDPKILYEFDNSYEDSNIIKSMKITKDGNFMSYSKVLSSKQMDIIADMVGKKIEEGAFSISKANFEIAPKKIEKENYGCKYCKFNDICFHTNNDIIELKPLDEKEILGGDDNELD